MAIEAVRPYIGMVQGIHGIPPGFWRDPYVLGYLYNLIGMFAKTATRGKAAGATLGYVLMDSFTVLSNMNGSAITSEANALALSGNPEFKRGGEDAMAVFLYTFGLHRNEGGDPLVIDATHLAQSMPEPGDFRTQVAGFMVHLSYMRHVREHLLR